VYTSCWWNTFCLGSGRFGVVRRATYNGKYVAVKFIKGGENDQELYELFCQEMQLIS
jgi:serine/threonine protein kinase